MFSHNLPDLVHLTEPEGQDGYVYRLPSIAVRERRIARARRVFGLYKQHQDRGDQADQAASEDHRSIDVSKVLQSLGSSDESVIRKALNIFHVKWYHCETERLRS